MIDTARLIITLNCKRNCPDCCNKTDPSVKSAEHIKNLLTLKNYKCVCITGGEPMLEPIKTYKTIVQIKRIVPEALIYLYTAWNNKIDMILPIIDGVHYTLHYPLWITDIYDFYMFQEYMKFFPDKSFRLYIDKRIKENIIIQPNLWYRVEIKPWMKECSLPINEKLFILDSMLGNSYE